MQLSEKEVKLWGKEESHFGFFEHSHDERFDYSDDLRPNELILDLSLIAMKIEK